MNLSGCESLAELHASLLSLDTLETLTLDGCKKLKSVKSEKHFRSLKEVSVNGCKSLKEFAVSSQMMERLDLRNAGIEKLDSSIGLSSKLWRINLEGLRLSNLPNELSSLKGLLELRISDCKQLVLDKQNHAIFDGLRSLRLLHLMDCCNLTELPDNINVLSKLSELKLDRSNVKTLPASIKHMTNLELLSLANCTKLKCLPELPTCTRKCYANNCTSLVTISTLNNFATGMTGRRKCSLLENCMKLNGPSLHHITKGAHLSVMNAIFRNVLLGRDGGSITTDFCLPGSSVPKQFTYQATGSSLTINLPPHSNVLGLVVCAVVSPFEYIKHHLTTISVQYYKADGTELGSHDLRGSHVNISGLKSDHVFIWQDAIHFDSTRRGYELKITVEFSVEDDLGDSVLDNCTKECGAHLIFDSDLPFLLRELDLDFESKWQLGLQLASKLGLELGSELRLELESQHRTTLTITEISDSDDEKESNDKHNQEQDQSESKDIDNQDQDLSERCYCFCDLFIGMDLINLSH